MKWFLSALMGILLLFVCTLSARADHILGGTLGYKFLSSSGDKSVYRITIELYKGCLGGCHQCPPDPMNVNPEIYIYKGQTKFARTRLLFIDSLSDIEITPLCPDYKDSTTCQDPQYQFVGLKKFVYVKDVELIGTDPAWQIFFFASMTPYGDEASVFQFINNAKVEHQVAEPPSYYDAMYLVAKLNNVNGPNSSPTFTSPPIPYYCTGKLSYYGMGAADEDHDEFKFTMIPARAVSGGNDNHYVEAQYFPPFTALRPLPTAADSFILNPSNGQMIFTPDSDMVCLVAVQVDEIRDGVIVGSTMRQMTFLIFDDCDAEAALTPVENIKNADHGLDAEGNLFLSAREGLTDTVSFDVNVTDPNHDNVTVSSDNIPSAANVTVENNGSQNPIVHFNWDLTDAEPVTYFFYLTYTDDGCPIATKKNIAYTFTVVPHNIKFSSGSSGSCATTSDGKGWINPIGENTIDYSYKWVDANGNILRNVHSLVGDTIKNVPPGIYKVYVRNSDGCGKNIFVKVDTTQPPIVVLQNDSAVCEGMPISLGTVSEPGVDYRWNTGQNTCCITATQTGNYILNASNHCGASSDAVNLDFVKCNYCLFIPNAFTPNGDGDNDVFKIIPTCLLQTFKIQIFNRYGQMVYVSYSLNDSWDGTFRGKPAGVGTYYYSIKADFQDVSRGILQLKGDVILIK